MDTIELPNRFRTIWISDIHLGTKGCQSHALLQFLSRYDCDHLYLVGDIVDIWRLKKTWYWDQSHNDMVQMFLRKARQGTHLTYIPGNHDEGAFDFCQTQFGNIRVADEAIHRTADGKRLLVMHGHAFDGVVKYAPWLALLGDTAYQVALWVNRWFNVLSHRLGYPYWSLSAYLKRMVKNAVEYIGSFEQALAAEARRRGVDGVVCGHIHHAEIRTIKGILYCNDGDWVESCTALVEHHDGRLEVLRWHAAGNASVPVAAAHARPMVA